MNDNITGGIDIVRDREESPIVEPITREFTEQLKAAMRDEAAWSVYLRPETIHRTEAGLRHLQQSLNNQVKVHGNPDAPDFDAAWLRRTTAFQNVVDNRLRQVERVSSTRVVDRRKFEKLVEHLAGFKHFAWELAVELEKCGAQGVLALHDIQAPGGEMDAMAWLDRRTEYMEMQEKQEALAAKRAEVTEGEA